MQRARIIGGVCELLSSRETSAAVQRLTADYPRLILHIESETDYPSHYSRGARGGADDEGNVVTTSMVRDAAKTNCLADLQLPTTLVPVAPEWDGLLKWFISAYEKSDLLKSDKSARYWYVALGENEPKT